MSNIIKYILFRTVLVIITLHTLIPHPHSNELTEKKHLRIHEESNSLIGFIRLAFHESVDENLDHLIFTPYENISIIDSDETNLRVSIFNHSGSEIRKRGTEKTTNWNTANFYKLLFVKRNGSRGPPLWV